LRESGPLTVYLLSRQQSTKITQRRLAHHKDCNQKALFRGLGNARWGLETTLERAHPAEKCADTLSLVKYYRHHPAPVSCLTTRNAAE
jgi:hypothetical protein